MSGPPDPTGAPLRAERADDTLHLRPQGSWTSDHARILHEVTSALDVEPASDVCIDFADVDSLDATGALFLWQAASDRAADPSQVRFTGASRDQERLLELIERGSSEAEERPAAPSAAARRGRLEALGASVVAQAEGGVRVLGFLGMLVESMFRVAVRPSRMPWTALVHHMADVGVRALPIVSLIGFLIGMVLAYQGVAQLSRFGAEVFVVDLVAVATLREVGILLTSLVVAGRSGSAFTAEIGSMMLSNEVDVMRVMGLDPLCRLVAPRAIALVLMLPLLTLAANTTSLLGGALGAWLLADLSFVSFVDRLREAVGPDTLAIGLVKAPIFALLIALAGCYQGLCVHGGASELGRRTTLSVVQGIFLVIVVDALFSVFFAEMGL